MYIYNDIARSSLDLSLSRTRSLSHWARTMTRGHRCIAASAGLGTSDFPMWTDSIRCSPELGSDPYEAC